MAYSQNAHAVSNQVARYLDTKLTRHDFPSDFVWGAATSCYQVEGAYDDYSKSHNNWDVWSVQKPGKIVGGTNGCVAIDHYHRVEHDVSLMKKLGFDSYRFSISWSRILPGGRLCGGINMEGIQFYNNIIDTLISQGITPCATIFHFDVPQCLEKEYGGFLSDKIQDDFAEYADVCFFHFGDRVKFWITMNEPWTFTHNGYISGGFPPGHGTATTQDLSTPVGVPYRTAPVVDRTVIEGGAATEPYIVAHNLILSHGRAVQIYRQTYQDVQGGKIGVTNMTTWYYKYSDDPKDEAAASRAVDFMWGWFVAPVVTGDYPSVMRDRVGKRLPKFNPQETDMIRGSYDFIGMNYYTSNWAAYSPNPIGAPTTYYTDQEVAFFTERDHKQIGKKGGSAWLFNLPPGMYELLMHTKNTYKDPIIYITENGWDEINNTTQTVTEAVKDQDRIDYHLEHLKKVKDAMEGARVKGYYAWSLFDNYEWAEGYSVRFGLYYVDYLNGLSRYPKDSAKWYMNFLNKNALPGPKPQVELMIEDNTAAKKRKAR